MIPAMTGFAILEGMVLAGVAVSLWTLWRVRIWLRAPAQKAAAGREATDAALSDLRRTADTLMATIEEMRQQAAPPSQTAPPRTGLNLSKRSQALRMHRRGDSEDQIAATLEIPRQEVDLLLKVHRIVISSMM